MTQQQLQQLGQQGHHPQLIAGSLSASSSTGSQQFGGLGKNGFPGAGVGRGVVGPTHPDGTTGPQENDPKATLMLELNAELLKYVTWAPLFIYMFFDPFVFALTYSVADRLSLLASAWPSSRGVSLRRTCGFSSEFHVLFELLLKTRR
jgi:hypothetical protein